MALVIKYLCNLIACQFCMNNFSLSVHQGFCKVHFILLIIDVKVKWHFLLQKCNETCDIWQDYSELPNNRYCQYATCISWNLQAGRHICMIIHVEITNKMQHCIKIYYSIFKWGSTCFGRHTAHHQELKTALAASGFAYVRGCRTLRLLDALQQPFMYAKPEAASAVLSSWWWALCLLKHVEPRLNME